MSYTVLARKWRPAQFKDIVGQGAVVQTVMNAIRKDRLHQAYLFTGSRGIGKTSIARIFSKAIRCENRQDHPEFGLLSCDQCASCIEITEGRSVDVLEIDGASNNGVDAIREIRENANYRPASGSKKIYIIDEVHMLTTAAFNALLKTLEEPPEHVIFVFATTEPHKIPATILSRCQRFDFKRVSVPQIESRLETILRAENIPFEPKALHWIARAAQGGMRDALSLLDQIIAFSNGNVTAEATRDGIGLIGSETLLKLLKAVLERNFKCSLEEADALYKAGHELRVVASSLLEWLHHLILAQSDALDSDITTLTDSEKSEVKALSKLRPIHEVELMFQMLHHGIETLARSPQPQLVFHVLLLKMARADEVFQPGIAPKGAAPSIASVPKITPPVVHPSPESKASPAPIPPQKAKPTARELASLLGGRSPSNPALVAERNSPPPVQNSPAQMERPESWEDFVKLLKKHRPFIGALVEFAAVSPLPSTEDAIFSLFFAPSFETQFAQLSGSSFRSQFEALVRSMFGQKIQIQIQISPSAGESLAEKRRRERLEQRKQAEDRVQNHPLLREARSLFGVELGPIEFLNPDPGVTL